MSQSYRVLFCHFGESHLKLSQIAVTLNLPLSLPLISAALLKSLASRRKMSGVDCSQFWETQLKIFNEIYCWTISQNNFFFVYYLVCHVRPLISPDVQK